MVGLPSNFEGMSGYRQRFVPAQEPPKRTAPSPPPVNTVTEVKKEPVIQENIELVSSVYDGQAIESYRPNLKEVFEMAKAPEDNVTSDKRCVGLDIGTGFISCAEEEESSRCFL